MKENFIFFIFVLLLSSCTRGNISLKPKGYTLVPVYPDIDLEVGSGAVTVSASGVKCFLKQKEVSPSFCGVDSNFDLSIFREKTIFSPEGEVSFPIEGSTTGSTVLIGEGERWNNVSQSEKKDRMEPTVTCNGGLVFSINLKCENPEYKLTFIEESNTLAPCSGPIDKELDFTCVYNITGENVSKNDCHHSTVIPIVTLLSPSGETTAVNIFGDSLGYSCSEGKTILDVGNGTTVESIHSCGPDRVKVGLECDYVVPEVFTSTDWGYPDLDAMEAGEGIVLIDAISVISCEDSLGNIVSNENCSLDGAPQLEVKSPEGSLPYIDPANGDTYSRFFGEGETTHSSETIVSCGPGRVIISGSCSESAFSAIFEARPALGRKVVLNIGFKSSSSIVNVDWGDGSPYESFDISGTNPEHTYSSSGDYLVKISGDFLFFNELETPTTIKSVLSLGQLTSMESIFLSSVSIPSISLTGLDTSSVVSLMGAFYKASSLTSVNFSGLDLSSVIDADYMFDSATGILEVDFSSNDLSSLTKMAYMFFNATALKKINLSSIIPSKIVTFSNAFAYTTNLKSIYLDDMAESEVSMFMSKLSGSGISPSVKIHCNYVALGCEP